MLLPLELKSCRTLWSGVVVCVWVSAVLLGKGPACVGPSAHLPEKSSIGRACGGRTWCKQDRQPVLGLYCSLKLVYMERWGRKWHRLAPSSPERGLCACRSQGSTPRRVNSFSPMHLRHFSDHHLHTACLSVVCLSGAAQRIWGSIPAKPADS